MRRDLVGGLRLELDNSIAHALTTILLRDAVGRSNQRLSLGHQYFKVLITPLFRAGGAQLPHSVRTFLEDGLLVRSEENLNAARLLQMTFLSSIRIDRDTGSLAAVEAACLAQIDLL